MNTLVSSFLFFFAAASLFAQDRKASIDHFVLNDQVIHGTIDEKYPITLYLKFDQSFEDGMSYSLSGWYYYDHVRKKIPLVGVCSDRFTLYQFADKERADSILQFKSGVSSMWEVMDDLSSRNGYLEKFDFGYQDYAYSGTWKNDKKELKLSLNTGDINLMQIHEFLVLQLGAQNKKHYDMKELGPYYYGYSVFAQKLDATGGKVLLKYDLNSRSNPNGMCGAGSEIGYLLLTFDGKGNLLDYRDEQVESCLGNIWSEVSTVPNANGKKLTYKIMYSDDKERTVTVDGTMLTLTSK